MSKHQLTRALKAELSKLNKKIDSCIVEGKSYKMYAQRHKVLLSQLRHVSTYESMNALGAFSFF